MPQAWRFSYAKSVSTRKCSGCTIFRCKKCNKVTVFRCKKCYITPIIRRIFCGGALTEQYVCQELHVLDELGVCYYTNERGSCEIDFIIDTGENIVPIEVKAETNPKAKSLKTYRDKFNPPLSIRTSMADFKKEDWLLNLPLYAIGQVITYTK